MSSSPISSTHSPPAEDEKHQPHEIVYPELSQSAKESGLMTIIGFGSLLSIRSCRSTFGDIRNFRPGVIRGWRRIFAHVAPIFIERGIASWETKEMSSLSVEPTDESATLLVSVFEIPISDLPAFYAREMEFRWVKTPVYSITSQPSTHSFTLDAQAIGGEGLLCAAYSDEEYRQERLKGNQRVWNEAVGRLGIDKLWRDDILPCPVYLRHVVLAAAGMDQAFQSSLKEAPPLEWRLKVDSSTKASESSSSVESDHSVPATTSTNVTISPPPLLVTPTHVSLPAGSILNSFLDDTFLGDRRTTIRVYLASERGNQIMCTPPPHEFRQRYNG